MNDCPLGEGAFGLRSVQLEPICMDMPGGDSYGPRSRLLRPFKGFQMSVRSMDSERNVLCKFSTHSFQASILEEERKDTEIRGRT